MRIIAINHLTALIQNAAARVLMKLKKREHITPVLMELHCYLCIKGLTIRFLH